MGWLVTHHEWSLASFRSLVNSIRQKWPSQHLQLHNFRLRLCPDSIRKEQIFKTLPGDMPVDPQQEHAFCAECASHIMQARLTMLMII